MKPWGGLFGPRIRCDSCGKKFRPNLKDVPQPDGGVLRVFECSRCGHETTVARITLRGRILSQRLQDTPITDQRRIAELRKLIKAEVRRPDGS